MTAGGGNGKENELLKGEGSKGSHGDGMYSISDGMDRSKYIFYV